MNILRHRLGFNFEDSKKILEQYIREKQKEIKQNKDQYDY